MSITKSFINKFLSLLLVLSVVLAGLLPSTAVYASEVNTPGSGTSIAELTAEGLIMDVTVPTNVLIYVDEHGEVTIPDYLPIINNSVAPVFVHSLSVTTENGWTLDPTNTDYTNFKVNQKNYWLSFNGLDPSNGPIALATPINGSDSLNLVLSADVAPQKTAINSLNIGEIVITFDWDAAEGAQEPVIPPETGGFTVGDVFHVYADGYGDLVFIPLLTGGAGNYRVIIVAEGGDPETQALVNEVVYKESEEESCTPGVPLSGYNPEQTYEVYVTYVDDEESETIMKVLSAKDTGGAGDEDSTGPNGEFIPEGYVLATDEDFSGTRDGEFRYIGTDEYVVIPHVIKGVPVTRYNSMFANTDVKGVASDNMNITNMSYMFEESPATTLDLRHFDTSNVTNMCGMFARSKATTLDLSNFDTRNVTDMRAMFKDSKVTTLDLSHFDTSKVTDMYEMFYESQATTLDLSNFDTSNVTDMERMFGESQATTLDISSFNLADTQPNVNGMFQYAQATTAYVSSQADIDYITVYAGTIRETLNFVVK